LRKPPNVPFATRANPTEAYYGEYHITLACYRDERDIIGPASEFLEAMEKDVLREKLAG